LGEGASVSSSAHGPGWEEKKKKFTEDMDARKARGEPTPKEEQEANRQRIIESDLAGWWEKGNGTKYGWAGAGVEQPSSDYPNYDESKPRGGLEVYPGAETTGLPGEGGYRTQRAYNEQRMKREGVVWPDDDGRVSRPDLGLHDLLPETAAHTLRQRLEEGGDAVIGGVEASRELLRELEEGN